MSAMGDSMDLLGFLDKIEMPIIDSHLPFPVAKSDANGSRNLSALASVISDTDLLFKSVEKYKTENAEMKSTLKEFKDSLDSVNRLYEKEKDIRKAAQLENQQMRKYLEDLENTRANSEISLKQTIAQMEEDLVDRKSESNSLYLDVTKQYFLLLKVLKDSGSLSDSIQKKNSDILKRVKRHSLLKNVAVEEIKVVEPFKSKNTRSIGTNTICKVKEMSIQTDDQSSHTEVIKEIEKEDVGTNTCPPSRITRGTQYINPEPPPEITSDPEEDINCLFLEEIFKETIENLPNLVEEIIDVNLPTPAPEIPIKVITKNAGTITDLNNINHKLYSKNSKSFRDQIKNEFLDEDSLLSRSQFEILWSMVGSMILNMVSANSSPQNSTEFVKNLFQQQFYNGHFMGNSDSSFILEQNKLKNFLPKSSPRISMEKEFEINENVYILTEEQSTPEKDIETVKKKARKKKKPEYCNASSTPLKKIRLCKPPASSLEQSLDSEDEFVDMDLIRAYYEVPTLIEPIGDLDYLIESIVQGRTTRSDLEEINELNCTSNKVVGDSEMLEKERELSILEIETPKSPINCQNDGDVQSIPKSNPVEVNDGVLESSELNSVEESSELVENNELEESLKDDSKKQSDFNCIVEESNLVDSGILNYESPRSPQRVTDEDLHFTPKTIPLLVNSANLSKSTIVAIMQKSEIFNRTSIANSNRQDVIKFRNIMKDYLSAEWTQEIVQITFCKIREILNDSNSGSLLEVMISSIGKLEDNLLFEPFNCFAPFMPKPHQQIVLLIEKLGLGKEVLKEIDKKLFTLSNDSESPKAIVNFTYVMTGLLDLEMNKSGDTYPVRLVLAKALYYLQRKCFIIVCMLLKAFPFCLPKISENTSCEDYNWDDPMIVTMQCILLNQMAGDNNPNLKTCLILDSKKRLLTLLQNHYNYKIGQPTNEFTVNFLMQRIDEDRHYNLVHAFLLLAKRFGWSWANDSILKKRIVPLVHNLIEINSRESENKLTICLAVISGIVKTMPKTETITSFQALFKRVLHESPSHKVQESAMAAILKCSSFGLVDTFQLANSWHAKEQISPHLRTMIKSFLSKKHANFWKTVSRQSS